MAEFKIRPGRRNPPGAIATDEGVNFCIFSRHATAVELILYESHDATAPFAVIALDPEQHRNFFFWSVFVEGIGPGVAYAWRIDGPRDIHNGFRFDPRIELLDPWARLVSHSLWDRKKAKGDFSAPRIRAIVPSETPFAWDGDTLLDCQPECAVIYELHVGGFTKHSSSGVEHPGTFLGLKKKIPYLKELGITHVELLPVMAFDEQDVPENVGRLGLKNFWGYSPHSFYALHPAYLLEPHHPAARNEFKELVKALHEADIGVILDVVFNHTAESGGDGPVINFKGMNNREFYHLDPSDKSIYLDFTGCGNTLKCNHPLVSFFIVHCLEYWVEEFHVDGFRFDLASVLARGEDAEPLYHAPVIWSLEFSNKLEKAGLIAEAWDASGLYQVGAFPGYRWQEWNGRYRDVIRQFVRGDTGMIGEMATRLAGSSDLYETSHRTPANGINFVTCHDGFTLYDLVSYERKHNEANGEQNRDGTDANFSCNYGVEGETDDPSIIALRKRQVKNFFSILLMSQGVPMLLAGDELLRTQMGNNNAWCQDNEISWLNWSLDSDKKEVLRFVQELVSLRRSHPSIMRRKFLKGISENGDIHGLSDLSWYGPDGGPPRWEDPSNRFLAFVLAGTVSEEPHLLMACNMDPENEKNFFLPELPLKGWWWRLADTSLPAPEDMTADNPYSLASVKEYIMAPRSVALFHWLDNSQPGG